jgi:hypothetical protein
MPRFYLHIHNSLGFAPDEEGRELADVERARDEAVKGARSLLSEEVSEGQLDLRGRIEVTDEQGKLVSVVKFEDVLRILTGPLPSSQQKAG